MVRRSSRSRQPATSAYDEELKVLAEKKKVTAVEETDSEESTEEEDFRPEPKKRETQPRAAATSRKTATTVTTSTRRATPKSIQTALTTLAKRALAPSETPQTSLLSALLSSSKPIPEIASVKLRTQALSHKETLYTPQLVGIARHWTRQYESNALQIKLLNLLFRGVGGNTQTQLPMDADLEELDSEEWDEHVTQLVQAMQDCEVPLLTATPSDKLGLREFRNIFQEFWYRLGGVVLSHSGSNSEDEPQAFDSNRFQVELIRDLITRVAELVLVGQPDLRAMATLAVWELTKACVERTVELSAKLATAQRQSSASKGQSRKLEALQHSMDQWKRHKAELEALVEESVLGGVFVRRYRDSNPYIRCQSLEVLTQLTLLRPDLYLQDKYLKYFGWMASDKDAMVRVAALKGLLAPFKHKDDKHPAGIEMDIQAMQNVSVKFLPRIADCTEDSQSLQVQEVAMELIIKLTYVGFMDDWDDDAGWDQLNLKALDAQTSPAVRKNALYLILDQLDCFDDGDDAHTALSSALTLSERQQTVRIEGIARWLAHLLCNGPVDLDDIQIDLTDLIVDSLRCMPEHKELMTNWSAMLKAIKADHHSAASSAERDELAKTRVLLRMLACAVQREVDASEKPSTTRKRKATTSSNSREELSLALLKSLPNLLTTFKSDDQALCSLVKLPGYLLPEVYSLSARKHDFSNLVRNLCSLFQESTDEVVLTEIAKDLCRFASGDHARVADVKMRIATLSQDLHERLVVLLEPSEPKSTSSTKRRSSGSRRSRRSDQSTSSTSRSADSERSEVETEHSLGLCLIRWCILLKSIPVGWIFSGMESQDSEESVTEGFFQSISEALGKRLLERKPVMEDSGSVSRIGTSASVVAPIWKSHSVIHEEVATVIDVGLDILLCVVAWTLHGTLHSEEELDDEEENPVLKMRDNLIKVIGLAFEQYVEEHEGVVYPDEQIDFASRVQVSAGRVACDLRTLFPKEWSAATSPVLKNLALENDFQLIGGFVRYLQSRQAEIREPETSPFDEETLVQQLVLPIARSLVANWTFGNRKEAGVILSHLTSGGKLTGQTILSLARLMKKIQPVRFLESQMAALRMTFQEWIDNEPEEPPEESMSESLIQEHEEALQEHQQMFAAAEKLASRLSMTLGVGKLRDERLSQALLNFLQEGVRFAFEGDSNMEDNLILGSRLPFLMLISKYSNWVKRNKNDLKILDDAISSRELALRNHPEFNDVHEDDIRCLADFKKSLGLSQPVLLSASTVDEASVDQPVIGTPTSSVASTANRRVP
eukprot:Nitzschia sp. Nitz4//scaffold50_size126154//44740//48960//NITZ4_003680-RA/size126154-augustus-gene-0.125-mRNA-1//-1//CDS//3329553683//537//frame0